MGILTEVLFDLPKNPPGKVGGETVLNYDFSALPAHQQKSRTREESIDAPRNGISRSIAR